VVLSETINSLWGKRCFNKLGTRRSIVKNLTTLGQISVIRRGEHDFSPVRHIVCNNMCSSLCNTEKFTLLVLKKRVESIRRGYNRMVPRRGLEPPRGCPHQHLKLACLPISPPRQEVSCEAKVSAHYTYPI
jgi:hypothetical protein